MIKYKVAIGDESKPVIFNSYEEMEIWLQLLLKYNRFKVTIERTE